LLQQKLLGQKNRENTGVSLEQFKGVKHRTQFVKEFQEDVFINDSKATNSLAQKNAIKRLLMYAIILTSLEVWIEGMILMN